MELLARHGVLDVGLAARLRRAVGFRNDLVHGYIAVDAEIVLARLHDPSDLGSFVTAVLRWLPGRQPPGPGHEARDRI